MYLSRREQQNLRSTSDVHLRLKSLEDKGVVRRDPKKPRAITVL